MNRIQKTALIGLGLACLPLAALPAASAVQTPLQAVAPASSVDAKTQGEIVESAAKALIDKYVFPDKGMAAAALIRSNFGKGQYAGLDRAGFVKKLTQNLQSVTHDKHLRVRAQGVPDELDEGGPPPPTMFGFERADRLKGDIGYVKLNGFHPPEALSVVADELMPKLAGTKALILDMRENYGGDPNGVSRLLSFFVAPGAPVHVNNLIWRKEGTNEYRRETFTTSATPVSYRNKPIYLLTSSGTFSGGEEFSYDMKVLKLATLVGETTGGGANPGDVTPLGSDFAMFVPSGRAENPITRTSWEGVGVKPDVAVPADNAFATAYAAALKATGQKAIPATKPDPVSTERLLVLRTTPYPQGESYIRRVADGLAQGAQAFDIMSPATAEALKGPVPPPIQSMMKDMGSLQSIRFVRVDEMGSDEYEATFAKGAQIWTLALDRAGKIIMLNFRPK